MGMTNDGLSYWQAEGEGISLLNMTVGDLLDRRADELPTKAALVYSCYPLFLLGPLTPMTHLQLSVLAMTGLLCITWQLSIPGVAVTPTIPERVST